MYSIIYELNYYDGPLEGVCSKRTPSSVTFYYYCITDKSDIHTDGPRMYHLYELKGKLGQPLRRTVTIPEGYFFPSKKNV